MSDDPRQGAGTFEDTALGTLGISLDEATAEKVTVSMEVGPRVHQPYGYLHGGVSCVLAETAMSIGAGLAAGPEYSVFGMEINANHLRPVRHGTVSCTGVPVHIGRTTQVWQARITDEQDRLVCISTLTIAVRKNQDS